MNVYHKLSKDTIRALETAPNMYLVLSPDLYVITASDLYLKAAEMDRRAIAGKHIFEAFPENPYLPAGDGIQNINASLQTVLSTRNPHQMSLQRYDVPDVNNRGKFIKRYWDPSHTPVLDDEGEILYIIQLANNVTGEIVTMRQELEESERHFRQLADLVPVKISNALPGGEVTYFNKGWLDYSHLTFEELRDFGYHQMLHPDEIAEFQAGLAEAADKGQPFEMEMRFLDSDGNYRWHLNIASPILNEQGKITKWVASTTEIHRMKEEEHRKTDFIGMVSHELKTPLTSLTGYLQMLQHKTVKTENAIFKRALDKAVNQVKKMTNMISAFLNVSRLESAKIHIEKERFDIAALMREMEEEAQTTIHTHELVFLPVEETDVIADREKIGQVINNLIANAVKYSHHGTRIEVSCETTADDIQICVKDQGFGIKPENLGRLFELYYRVEGTQMKNIAGFGIGLFLCAEIIKLHGGKIWAESEFGIGSAFYFTLPLEVNN